jgi:hypothetical protein
MKQVIGQEAHFNPSSAGSTALIASLGQTFVHALQSTQISEMEAFFSGAMEMA